MKRRYGAEEGGQADGNVVVAIDVEVVLRAGTGMLGAGAGVVEGRVVVVLAVGLARASGSDMLNGDVEIGESGADGRRG